MNGPLRVARRELSSLTAEKTIVLALLVQLFVAAFSSFLIVGLTALYAPAAAGGGTAVDIAVTGDARSALLAAADNADGLQPYEDQTAALSAFNEGRVDAVLVVRQQQRADGSRVAVDAVVPESSLRKTLVVVRVRELLEALERAERIERRAFIDRALAPRPPAVDASPYFGFSYTVLIPLLLLLPAFIAGSTAVDTLTEEIERGTLELLRVAPLSLSEVIAGKGIAMAALAPAQAALWLALLRLNDIAVAQPSVLLAYTAAVTTLLVVGGLALALLVPNRERAQLLYSLGALVAFTLAGFLPEHPATTIARIGIGSPAPSTYALVAVTVGAAIVSVLGLAKLVERIDVESL